MHKRPPSGTHMEHDASTCLEIYWNFLYANATAPNILTCLRKRPELKIVRSGLSDCFTHCNQRIRSVIQNVRQFSPVSPPCLLKSYHLIKRNSGIEVQRYCQHCARFGIHSIEFTVGLIDQCPVHKTPLLPWNGATQTKCTTYQSDLRVPLVKAIDASARNTIKRLTHIDRFLTSVEPMRDARGTTSRFMWQVSAHLRKNSAGAWELPESDQHTSMIVAPPRFHSGLQHESIQRMRVLYYRELLGLQSQVIRCQHQHQRECERRERLICGLCNGIDAYLDRVSAISDRIRFHRWLKLSLWPKPVHLEEWYLSPTLDNWIAPGISAFELTDTQLSAVLRHELFRLLFAHLLYGISRERYSEEDTRRQLIVDT